MVDPVDMFIAGLATGVVVTIVFGWILVDVIIAGRPSEEPCDGRPETKP